MLIDTHCHLIEDQVPADTIAGIIQRAKNAGVGTIIVPSAHPDDPRKVLALCEQYGNLFCTLGAHPEFAGIKSDNYESLLSHTRVVGVGEIGLDYHTRDGAAIPDADRKAQIQLFRDQLDVAKRAGLPVAVHTREAEQDTADILCSPEYSALGGVMHCYTSSWELAKKMLDRGFYFSASGIITFKNSADIRDVFRRLPADRIVIETDAPYCAPVPYRGKVCEPAMLPHTARILAETRQIPMEELENTLLENTGRLYPKMSL